MRTFSRVLYRFGVALAVLGLCCFLLVPTPIWFIPALPFFLLAWITKPTQTPYQEFIASRFMGPRQ